jgi:hypothetical protein
LVGSSGIVCLLQPFQGFSYCLAVENGQQPVEHLTAVVCPGLHRFRQQPAGVLDRFLQGFIGVTHDTSPGLASWCQRRRAAKGCVAEPRQLPGAATSPRVGEAWWFRHAQGLSEKTPIATRVSRALRRYSQQAALFLDLNCRYS